MLSDEHLNRHDFAERVAPDVEISHHLTEHSLIPQGVNKLTQRLLANLDHPDGPGRHLIDKTRKQLSFNIF